MAILETEIELAVARAQNVPFVGATQRRIAKEIMPLIQRQQNDDNEVIEASQSVASQIAHERDSALGIIQNMREYVDRTDVLDASAILEILNRVDDEDGEGGNS